MAERWIGTDGAICIPGPSRGPSSTARGDVQRGLALRATAILTKETARLDPDHGPCADGLPDYQRACDGSKRPAPVRDRRPGRTDHPAALQDRVRGVTRYEVTRTTTSDSGRVSMMPVEFVRLDEQ